jgi:hypothetical protein
MGRKARVRQGSSCKFAGSAGAPPYSITMIWSSSNSRRSARRQPARRSRPGTCQGRPHAAHPRVIADRLGDVRLGHWRVDWRRSLVVCASREAECHCDYRCTVTWLDGLAAPSPGDSTRGQFYMMQIMRARARKGRPVQMIRGTRDHVATA